MTILRNFNEPTTFYVIGTSNGNEDFSLTDDECTFDVYINDVIHGCLNTDGSATIVEEGELQSFIDKMEFGVEDMDAFEIMKVHDFQGDLLICLRSESEVTEFGIPTEDYIYFDKEIYDFRGGDNEYEVALQFKDGDKLSEIVSISIYKNIL